MCNCEDVDLSTSDVSVSFAKEADHCKKLLNNYNKKKIPTEIKNKRAIIKTKNHGHIIVLQFSGPPGTFCPYTEKVFSNSIFAVNSRIG